MKEMKYEIRDMYSIPEVLSRGIYRGYEYVILTQHSHPTAYIVLEEGHKWFGKNYDDIELWCHGGLTYSKNYLGQFLEYSDKYKCDVLSSITNKWVIGWDYAHYGDYLSYSPMSDDKKWTTQEIIEEVKKVIDSIK